MLLHLLRHGQSQWNLERRVQGQTAHVPLTARGADEARAAREALCGRPISAI